METLSKTHTTPVSYSIEKVAGVISGKLLLNNPGCREVSHLVTDSRKLITPSVSLFFALQGDRRNGHEFIEPLIKAGVCNFVISNSEFSSLPDANFILVPDTLDALQRLAAFHRMQYSIPVIGITGSNGKTIVKEWLYQLLREDHHIVRSPKSYNSQIGVALSVWQMQPDHDLGIFEAGISKPGEMENLEQMIRPETGIFTNLGSAHDENFSSHDEKAVEKLKLFSHSSSLIFCRDYPVLKQQVEQSGVLPKEIRLFTWSRKVKADLQVGRITRENGETEIQGIYKNHFISIRIPFTDEASVENAIHCWSLMLLSGYDNDRIRERMQLLSPVAMRLEMKEGINNCSVINDSYNSDIGSLTIALDFMNQQKQHEKKTVILSDILQSGRSHENLYAEVASLLKQKNIYRLIGIGPALSEQQHLFGMEKSFYPSTDDFLKNFYHGNFHNEAILVKGARPFGFERISRMLQRKAHETVLEINLNALTHNLNFYRARLKSDTKIMCMVKAFAYGSGIAEIASSLQFQGVDYLAVAYADEGVELRRAGITLPIMVMNPEEQSFESMIMHNLEPEIYCFRIMSRYSESVKRSGRDVKSNFPIHLKLDTGMHRLGFELKDLNELVVRLKNNRQLKLISVFSHLAASDEPAHDSFTKKQIELFTRFCHELKQHIGYPFMRHILNSAGIIRFPEAQFEMIRLGIGLHGIAATPSEQKHLQHVSRLKTTISQIKLVPAGESVGYNCRAVAAKDMLVATVAIGYADGFNRRLGNGIGKMIVNGKPAPVVGNVCMDMTMLDITDIPAREGDEVIIFGNEYPITKFAADMGTIPYEVLTSVSQRVRRIYFHE